MKANGWWKGGIELAIMAFAWWGFDWKVAVISFLWLWLMNVREHLNKEQR